MKRRSTILREQAMQQAEQDKYDVVLGGLYTAYMTRKLPVEKYERLLKTSYNNPPVFLIAGTQVLKECGVWK